MPDTKPRSTAVAIKRDGAAVSADAKPTVIAKGHGAIAEQILQLAFANGVKVRQDSDLIEILDAIEIESEIPVAAMATVAEILSYLYRLNANPADPSPSDNETP